MPEPLQSQRDFSVLEIASLASVYQITSQVKGAREGMVCYPRLTLDKGSLIIHFQFNHSPHFYSL